MDSNERLIQAVQLATRKLVSSGNFDDLMKDVLRICVEAVDAFGGTIYLHDPEERRLRFQHVLPEVVRNRLPVRDVAEDYGTVGQAFQLRQTVRRTFPEKPQSEWNDFERGTGVAVVSIMATPLLMEDETPIGVVQLINKRDGAFNDSDTAVLDTVAAVASMAYANFRLTEESTRASTLLGMGKVSHDIGNLAASLRASIGYGDLAMHGLKDHLRKKAPDATVTKLVDVLDPLFEDLRESTNQIVGYSRLISDLAAGRELRPIKKLAPMADAIRRSAEYLESDGRSQHVHLMLDIDKDAPPTLHDELYIMRIVQNLVGNAIKAVHETVADDSEGVFGEVHVHYCFDGENHIIEVSDTGPGMDERTAARILSGQARSQWDKASGSGWGTKIVLELAATHDGKVTIDSKPGHGATFRVTLPHDPRTEG
jgi:signal transduction histidine kinase